MDKVLQAGRLDLMTLKSYVKPHMLVLFAGIAIFMGFSVENSMSIAFGSMIGFLFVSYPFALAERDNLNTLYATLPVSKVKMVIGRYLFAAVIVFIGMASGSVMSVFAMLVDKKPVDLKVIVITAASFFVAFVLLLCIQFPLYYKLGYTKGRLVVFIPLMLISAVGLFVGNNIKDTAVWTKLIAAAQWVEAHPQGFAAVVFLAVVVSVVVSIFASVKLSAKNEY